jgi:hypothetical protein
MATITINHEYTGPYELVPSPADNMQSFESAQSAVAKAGEPEPPLEVTTIKWSISADNKISGTAKFISVEKHDLINADLSGTSPPPPAGQNYREANVDVTFSNGTGSLAGATGTGKVQAKLYDNFISTGRLTASINVP